MLGSLTSDENSGVFFMRQFQKSWKRVSGVDMVTRKGQDWL